MVNKYCKICERIRETNRQDCRNPISVCLYSLISDLLKHFDVFRDFRSHFCLRFSITLSIVEHNIEICSIVLFLKLL